MRPFRIATVALLLCCTALPAAAQAVKLEFHDGNVSLTAENAALRTILTEWARLGGTQLINADKISGAPVTLQLANVPEVKALDIILRGSAGYIVSQRAAAAASQSMFDRILIVPTAGTAAVQPRPAATPPPFSFPQPQVQPPPPDPDDNPVSDVPPDDDQPPRGVRPPNLPGRPTVPPQPFQPGDDDRPGQPQPATPANPFGVQPGSSRPGVITPAPQQPQRPRPQPDPEP
jgi:hypothetical protein